MTMTIGAVASGRRAATVNAVTLSSASYRQDSTTLAGTDMTWACWFKAPTVTGSYHSFLSASADGSNYWITSVSSSGVLVQDNHGEYTTGHSVGAGVWHYVAVAHHEGSGAIEFYYAVEGAGALTKVNFTGSTGAYAGYFQIGIDFFASPLNGSMAQVKVWTAALSQAEVEAEWHLDGVARTSGLWGYWSFRAGPQTTDESGNGRTLTVFGTPTLDTAGPGGF